MVKENNSLLLKDKEKLHISCNFFLFKTAESIKMFAKLQNFSYTIQKLKENL